MTVAALIPARYASTRFPAKLLQMIGQKSVIRHVYDNAVETGLFDFVAVVTDHELIFDSLAKDGCKVFLSETEHENGTSRIAEIASGLDYDIIINIQGDEPFLNKNLLAEMIEVFRLDREDEIKIVTPMTKLSDNDSVTNPNIVKVVTDRLLNAMYFSRSVIPYKRNAEINYPTFRHIGIYAFRKAALLEAVTLEQTPLDAAEMIECIRYLEHGMKIRMVVTDHETIAIDVPEDLEKARGFYESTI